MSEDGEATFKLKGREGEYVVTFEQEAGVASRSVLVSSQPRYLPPTQCINQKGIVFKRCENTGPFTMINVQHEKLVIAPIGFRNWFGALGYYILISLVVSLILRKVLKVY